MDKKCKPLRTLALVRGAHLRELEEQERARQRRPVERRQNGGGADHGVSRRPRDGEQGGKVARGAAEAEG